MDLALSIMLRNSVGLICLLCTLSFHFGSAPGFAYLSGIGIEEEAKAVVALIWEQTAEQRGEDGSGSDPVVQAQVFVSVGGLSSRICLCL